MEFVPSSCTSVCQGQKQREKVGDLPVVSVSQHCSSNFVSPLGEKQSFQAVATAIWLLCFGAIPLPTRAKEFCEARVEPLYPLSTQGLTETIGQKYKYAHRMLIRSGSV